MSVIRKTRDGDTLKFATFSEDEKYRYCLGRYWGSRVSKTWQIANQNIIVFIGLNPSTATHEEDDQTIMKLTHWAKKWKYNGFVIVNLFALRNRNPTALYTAKAPEGPENASYIETWLNGASLIVPMWGNHGALLGRGDEFLKKYKYRMQCFGYTKNGSPIHPLMLGYDTELVEFKAGYIPPTTETHSPVKATGRPNRTQESFRYEATQRRAHKKSK